MGVRTVVWAPGGRWIALGGWDGQVRILESEGWRCIVAIRCATRIDDKKIVVFLRVKSTAANNRILDGLERAE